MGTSRVPNGPFLNQQFNVVRITVNQKDSLIALSYSGAGPAALIA